MAAVAAVMLCSCGNATGKHVRHSGRSPLAARRPQNEVATLAARDVAKAKAYVEQLLIMGLYQLRSSHKFPLPQGVASIFCSIGSCILNAPARFKALGQINKFMQTAESQQKVSDKVTTHSYQVMYGTFLMPLMKSLEHAKILEIGLGCDMDYGPGASVALWKALFPNADLWEAEFNAKCVQECKGKPALDGVKVLIGDQGDRATVGGWITQSGGQFDAIIDDGGHKNNQIRTSFELLWPTVKPGGLYSLEDLQVGRMPAYRDAGDVVMSDIVQAWVGQLLTNKTRKDFPLPQKATSIFCQRDACIVFKAS